MAESKLANMIFSSKVMEHKDFTKDIKHDKASKNAKNSVYGLYRIMATQYAMNQLDEDQRKSGDKSKPTDGQYMKLISGAYTTLIQRSRKARRHYAKLKDTMSAKHEMNTPRFDRVSMGLKNSKFLYYYGHKGKTDFINVAHRDHAKGIPLSSHPVNNASDNKTVNEDINKNNNADKSASKNTDNSKNADKTKGKADDTKRFHLSPVQRKKYEYMRDHNVLDYPKSKYRTPRTFVNHVKHAKNHYDIPKQKGRDGKAVNNYLRAVPKKMTKSVRAKVVRILAEDKANMAGHAQQSGATSDSSLGSDSKSLADLSNNPYDNKNKSHSASSSKDNSKNSSNSDYSPQEKAAKFGPSKHPFINRGINAFRSHRVHSIIRRKKFFARQKADHHQHRQEINHMKARAWAQRMGSEIPNQYSGHSHLHRRVSKKIGEAQRYAQASHNKFHKAVHENTALLYNGIDHDPRVRALNNALSLRNAVNAGFHISNDAKGLAYRTWREQHHGRKFRKYNKRTQRLENLNSNTIKKPGKGAFNRLFKKAKAKSRAAAKAGKADDSKTSASSEADAAHRAAVQANQSLGAAPQQSSLGQAPGTSSSNSSYGSAADAGPSL